MTSGDMVMSSGRGITFMYRAGAIAVHEGRLLVEKNLKFGFCFVPGGRVEYGDNAVDTLVREMREELGEEARVGRLVVVADNLFELDGGRYQEVGLYFLIEFEAGSQVLRRQGQFAGNEPGETFQWIGLDELEQANLLPVFLRERVRSIPRTTEYVAHADFARDPEPDPAIRIVAYDPTWPRLFSSEAAKIRAALGDVAVDVHHVGSTSVPGLRSKPIVDILVTVSDISDPASYRAPLERIGYGFTDDPEFPDFHFFGRPRRRPRRFHVHVCEAGGAHERRHLAVRDYLAAHPQEARRYGSIKAEAAASFPGDRIAYMDAKDPWVSGLQGRALSWRERQGWPAAGDAATPPGQG